MKLVLLPGMDGTGKLFESFLENLETADFEVIALPNQGTQDYRHLSDYVSEKLPNEEHILLAESFSGPIAMSLIQKKTANIRGIIFVASFLSAPNRFALALAKIAPLKLLVKLPFASGMVRYLMLGPNATAAFVTQFREVISGVPSKVLRARIDTLRRARRPEFSSNLPVVYISGDKDKLVSQAKIDEFRICFKHLTWKQMSGPHFLLQASPKETSKLVLEALSLLTPPIHGHK